MKTSNALQAYQAVGVESRVEGANPHQLVTMLFRGLLDRLSSAKGAIHSGDIAHKGKAISEAISIVDGLRACVDVERGGEVAQNLTAVYDFVEGHLVQANIDSDADMLTEAREIISSISEGWESMPEEVKHRAGT